LLGQEIIGLRVKCEELESKLESKLPKILAKDDSLASFGGGTAGQDEDR